MPTGAQNGDGGRGKDAAREEAIRKLACGSSSPLPLLGPERQALAERVVRFDCGLASSLLAILDQLAEFRESVRDLSSVRSHVDAAAYELAAAVRLMTFRESESDRELPLFNHEFGMTPATPEGPLLEKLVESRPDWSLALQRLSIARLLVAESRYQLDELELSEEKLEEALATAVSAFDAAKTPKLLSEALFSQTRILSRRAGIAVGTGRLAEAISAQEQSLELVARAVAIVPEKAEKLSFTRAHELDQMSILYCYDSRYEDAERVSLEALDIYRSLHLEAPQNAVYERGLVLGLNSMGRLSVMQKEPADALPYYSEALSIARERSRRSPDDIEAQRDLGYCNFFTAVAQGDLKQFDLALESYLLAGECFEDIYERQPESAVALRDHTMCALSIADTYVGLRRYTEAMERGEACLKIYEEIVARNPENLSRVRDVVVAKNIIGGAALSLAKDESLSPGERRTYLEAARDSFQGALDRFEGLDEAGMLMESDRQYLPMLGSRLEEIERVGEELTTRETEPGGN